MSNLVTIPQAAKLFSASVPGVRAWIRDGMPAVTEKPTGRNGRPRILLDPVAARTWLIEKGARTFLKSEVAHSEAAKQEQPASVPVPAAQPQKVSITPGVEGAIDRLRNIELRTFSDYVKARNAGDALGQRAYMKLHSEAVKRMIETEEVAEIRKAVEAEVWAQVEQALTAWSEPVKALCESMPRALASRCNIGDPGVAEAVLKDWVTQQLFPMMNRRPQT